MPIFTLMTVLLWTLTVVHHFKDRLRLSWHMLMMPRGPWDFHHEPNAECSTLRKMPGAVSWLLTLGVMIPATIFHLALLRLGSALILSTVGIIDCLLNTVALEFVLNFAELFYFVFVPTDYQKMIERLALQATDDHAIPTMVLSGASL